MLTLVLSGPSTSRTQALAVLRQAGCEVDDSDHPHGFEPGDGEGFITAYSVDLDAAVRAAEQVDWVLRSHWEQTGTWSKIGNGGSPLAEPDALAEIRRLRAEIRAAGVGVSD